MQESGSKFLFDPNSQGNPKFEDPSNSIAFNSRFPNSGFDFYFSKLVANQLDEASNLNKSYQSIRTPHSINIDQKDKIGFNSKAIIESDAPQVKKKNGSAEIDSHEIKHSRKKVEKNFERSFKDEEFEIPGILRHPIAKFKDLKNGNTKSNGISNIDSIFIRFYPKNLTTKSLMLRLNNFPRLEIKYNQQLVLPLRTSKKNNLKKILDHLRRKWLNKLNTFNEVKFDIQITPNQNTWLKHLDEFNKRLGLPQEEVPMAENYMISDIWAGYNEPSSNKIDLYYEIKENTKAQEISTHSIFGEMQQKNSSRQGFPSQIKKQTFFIPNPINHISSLSNSEPPMATTEIGNETSQASINLEKSELISSIPKDRPLPSIIHNDQNSRTGSAFSINEASNRDSKGFSTSKLSGANEQSLKILYNHLNQKFPDDTNFTSQLFKQGETSAPKPVEIKKIPVKRKVDK